MIYVDNAATTKVSAAAKEKMIACMDTCWENPSSLHTPGQKAAERLQQAREQIAACLGANASEVYFTSGGSESDNQAILSAAARGAAQGKRHIISTAFEHHAVLHPLEQLAKQGYDITLLDVHEDGLVRPEELRAAIRPDTALVTILFANNEIGTIQPIAELGAICQAHNVPFHTDATQAAGHLPLDVKAMHIDLLSLSAHKFHGPKGIGVLYARRGFPLTSLIAGGAQERSRRAGTENLPAIVGMAEALQNACREMARDTATLTRMRDKLIAGLSTIPHSILNGDAQQRLPGNVNFCFEGIEGEALLLLLDAKGIAASSGSACTSGSLEPSHVLLAIGRPHEIAHGSLRLSLSAENTEAEMDRIIDSVREVVAYLRSISPVWQDLVKGEKPYVIQ